MNFLNDNWSIITGAAGMIIWIIRLEGRVNMANERIQAEKEKVEQLFEYHDGIKGAMQDIKTQQAVIIERLDNLIQRK